eukprot:TRINITY_DN5236_c0_g1_i2.p1 TRINITY_DN5236_c0_g1~~TRINITY_DN5236_c0_g1_i2.p1  ORF type:complete len:400 (+),score=44.91 TRINITY_DN5236_c0_g1_i2:116-1315(+)
METLPPSPPPPKDPYYFFWIVILCLGIATLSPWNAIITANLQGLYNNSLIEFELSLAYNVPAVFLLFLSTLLAPKISLWIRIVVPLLLEVLVLAAITLAVFFSTKSSQTIYVILVASGFAGGLSSILFGSVLGLAALFPPVYSTSFMSGVGAGGIMIGLMRIITLWAVPNNVTSSAIYFGCSAATMVICIVLYYFSTKLEYVEYHLTQIRLKSEPASEKTFLLETESQKFEKPKYEFWWNIQKKIWLDCFNVFVVFFVTLCFFPGLTTIIPYGATGPKWFPVIIIFFFQVFDFVGRTLPVIPSMFPEENRELVKKFMFVPRKYLWIPIILRTGFAALFIMCIKQVVFEGNGWAYTFQSLFAITNGYLGTLAIMYGPEQVEPQEKETAGIMMVRNFFSFL